MKTVLLFIPHLGVGGSELQLCLLAPRLRDAGWEPVVATMEDLHGIAPRLAVDRVEVVFLPRSGRSGIDAVTGLARLTRNRRAALVHAWLWASNWRAAVARLATPGPRLIASIRSMEDDLTASHQIAYRALAPLMNAIIVNSRAILAHSAARTGIPADKYRLVRNGVELARLEREAREPVALSGEALDGPVVGYVGTLHARKRAASLAPVAAKILGRVPSARFLIVGDGPERAQVEAACTRLGIADRFHFVGYASRVAPHLARMSVLLHPSANEGSSNSILEAMAVGIPVVAYAVSGNLETVTHGETGLLAADGNEDQLASAAAGLLLNPDEARRFGAAGRARIASDFSVQGMVDATVKVYDDAVSGR